MTNQDETAGGVSPGGRKIAPTDRGPDATRTSVPPAAKWLGALGVLPFVVPALAGLFLDGPFRENVSFALAVYGAVILSFLGGVHWGLTIAGFGPEGTVCRTSRRLAYSVIPSLVGWGALLLPRPIGLLILAAAFAGAVLFDTRASRIGEAPAWYPKLRWPLSVVVVASLLLGALA
jgi:hypothetical protein